MTLVSHEPVPDAFKQIEHIVFFHWKLMNI